MSDKNSKLYIGVDLGGTNISVGLINGNFEFLAKHSVPTAVPRPYQEIIADMAGAINTILDMANVKLDDCISIGIGSPGICDSENGIVTYSNNLYWENVDICKELHNHLPIPIFLSNDANCAAYGEVLCGAAKGAQNAIMVTLGTGFGCGIVIDGKIYAGQKSQGAEGGHIVLVMDGELCTCGRKGCLEAYASATGLIRQTKAKMQLCPDSKMFEIVDGDIEKVNGKTAFDAAKLGDTAGLEVVEQYTKYVGEGLVDLVNLFRPEAVIVGGGVSNESEYLMRPLNDYVAKNTFGSTRIQSPQVVKATLGNDAGIIGAAFLK